MLRHQQIEQDLKSLRKRFEEAKGLDDTMIDEYLSDISDNCDKFWYYLDERSSPATKRGPHTRKEMGELLSAKAIDDSTLVWHPCVGGWKVAAHVPLLRRVRKGTVFHSHYRVGIPAAAKQCVRDLKHDDSLQPARVFCLVQPR